MKRIVFILSFALVALVMMSAGTMYGYADVEEWASTNAPSVKCSPPAGASAGVQPTPRFSVHSPPIADAQRDVDDVVARPAAVGEAGVVAAQHAEAVLRRDGVGAIAVFSRSISDGDDVGRLVDALDAGQEGRHQVGAREVGRRLDAGARRTAISSSAGSVGLVT